jgi:hypothetical protein
VRSSKAVEVKWGILPAGEKRAAWTTDDQRTTLVLLVSGNLKVELEVASFMLEGQGDYLVWRPGNRPFQGSHSRLCGRHGPLAIVIVVKR